MLWRKRNKLKPQRKSEKKGSRHHSLKMWASNSFWSLQVKIAEEEAQWVLEVWCQRAAAVFRRSLHTLGSINTNHIAVIKEDLHNRWVTCQLLHPWDSATKINPSHTRCRAPLLKMLLLVRRPKKTITTQPCISSSRLLTTIAEMKLQVAVLIQYSTKKWLHLIKRQVGIMVALTICRQCLGGSGTQIQLELLNILSSFNNKVQLNSNLGPQGIAAPTIPLDQILLQITPDKSLKLLVVT